MPIPLGILAAAGFRPAAAGAFQLLETALVGSGGQASINFANVNTYASTYQHLQIRLVNFSGQANLGTILLNSSRGVHSHALRGRAGAVTSFANGGSGDYLFSIGSSTDAGFAVIDLLDPFESGKNKTARGFTGSIASTSEVLLTSALYTITDPITSISISHPNGFNWLQGSRFSLYGLKVSA